MKKITITIIFSFLIICIFVNFSYGIFVPYVYESTDKKVLAYAELNTAVITLPSGVRIHSTRVNGDTNMDIQTITVPVELVFVVDTSSSMGGSRIDFTKNAMKTLSEKLFNVVTSLNIHLIEFNSICNYLGKYSTNDDLKVAINNLHESGTTNMLDAVKRAKAIFQKSQEESQEERKKYYLIVLTDGVTDNEERCYDELTEIVGMSVEVYNVIVEMNTNRAFTYNGEDAGFVFANVRDEDIEEIYNEIYDNICFDLINNNVSDFIENARNYFVADNNLYMFLDNEYLQDSTLELEYIINIKSAKDVNKLELQGNIDNKLVFQPSAKIITEDKTNEEYGWAINEELSYKNGNGVVISLKKEAGQGEEPIIKRGQPYKSKFVVTCLLSSKDDTNYENNVIFRLNDEANSIELDSMEINVIPPFGENHNIFNIVITIMILGIIGIVIYKKEKDRK